MKFIKGILIFFGILFLIELILVGVFYFTDPLGLWTKNDTASEQPVNNEEKDDHPLLNESQEKALEKIGVETTNLPSTITPEMESCFIEKLGQERVNEIIAGDSPSPVDLLKGKDCIN